MSELFTYPKRRVCATCDQDVPAPATQHADLVYTDQPHAGCKKPPHWTDALNLGRRPVPAFKVKTTTLRPPSGFPKQCVCGFKPGSVRGWTRRDSSLQCPSCGVTVFNHL